MSWLNPPIEKVIELTFDFVKFLPFIHIQKWLWIWIIVIAFIKIGNMIWRILRKKKFVLPHTMMNKITGLLLFLLPLTLHFAKLQCSLTVVCLVATFSAIQEGFYQ